MYIYKHHGDSIMVTRPGSDDVLIHYFHTEYERRELLVRGDHNADSVESALAQGLLMFHGPSAQEDQVQIIKKLCALCRDDINKKHDRDAAIERLGQMILEREMAYHA